MGDPVLCDSIRRDSTHVLALYRRASVPGRRSEERFFLRLRRILWGKLTPPHVNFNLQRRHCQLRTPSCQSLNMTEFGILALSDTISCPLVFFILVIPTCYSLKTVITVVDATFIYFLIIIYSIPNPILFTITVPVVAIWKIMTMDQFSTLKTVRSLTF